jgi:hypothetical protein
VKEEMFAIAGQLTIANADLAKKKVFWENAKLLPVDIKV